MVTDAMSRSVPYSRKLQFMNMLTKLASTCTRKDGDPFSSLSVKQSVFAVDLPEPGGGYRKVLSSGKNVYQYMVRTACEMTVAIAAAP